MHSHSFLTPEAFRKLDLDQAKASDICKNSVDSYVRKKFAERSVNHVFVTVTFYETTLFTEAVSKLNAKLKVLNPSASRISFERPKSIRRAF